MFRKTVNKKGTKEAQTGRIRVREARLRWFRHVQEMESGHTKDAEDGAAGQEKKKVFVDLVTENNAA